MKKSVHSESEMVKAVQELENGIHAETVAILQTLFEAYLRQSTEP